MVSRQRHDPFAHLARVVTQELFFVNLVRQRVVHALEQRLVRVRGVVLVRGKHVEVEQNRLVPRSSRLDVFGDTAVFDHVEEQHLRGRLEQCLLAGEALAKDAREVSLHQRLRVRLEAPRGGRRSHPSPGHPRARGRWTFSLGEGADTSLSRPF